MIVSRCCQYSVYICGRESHYYVCRQCGRPCDTMTGEPIEMDDDDVTRNACSAEENFN